MIPRRLLVASIIATALAMAVIVPPPLLFGRPWSEAEGECPHHPEACFFSDTYDGARALFREHVAKLRQAELTTLRLENVADLTRLPLRSGSVNLTIDVAVVRGEGAELGKGPVLIHLSGVHGVEGHAGSAIQSAYLARVSADSLCPPPGVTVVLVHALNPFGFMCGRRWNENSVDLNRNMLPADTYGANKFDDRKKEGLALDWDYQAISSVINPGQATWTPFVDDILFMARVVLTTARFGLARIKQALVTGQYYNPKGMWFGGDKLEQSHELLLAHLRTKFAEHDPVMMIDVHTGLGPTGVDTLIVAQAQKLRPWTVGVFGEPDAKHPEVNKRFLVGGDGEPPLAKGGFDAIAYYGKVEGATMNYLPAMRSHGSGWTRAVSVTQDFGTVPATVIVWAMVKENTLWHHADDQDARSTGSRATRDVFYVRTASWQHSVVVRGLTVIEQAEALLSKASDPQDEAWINFPRNEGEMTLA